MQHYYRGYVHYLGARVDIQLAGGKRGKNG
jgi:hypothetical protein